jgi:hypothetical protein
MKRYSLQHDELYDRVIMSESPTGQWVPAEVAKALYDLLSVYHDKIGAAFVGVELSEVARKALYPVDGDEQ